mmetsp:Transcript_32358/g.62514  ORF Transcript_32358/g.62514 Transcript_32358/m.62514 type:complete len:80 (-) Transcript_32358:313-552(-)
MLFSPMAIPLPLRLSATTSKKNTAHLVPERILVPTLNETSRGNLPETLVERWAAASVLPLLMDLLELRLPVPVDEMLCL